jgi:acyl-CoA thioester hydrolase
MYFHPSRLFRVRQYECDLFHHLNNAVYFRYLQETALEHEESAGLNLSRQRQSGHRIWHPGSAIEYLSPLKYGENVAVIVENLEVSERSWKRLFTFTNKSAGGLAARAVITSQLIRVPGREICDLPADVFSNIMTGQKTEQYACLAAVPNPPPPPPGMFSMKRIIRGPDVNADGEVDLAVLLSFVDECGQRVLAAHGWPVQRMLAEGFGILLRRNLIKLLEPIRLEDELEISSWFWDLRRATAWRHYRIKRLSDQKVAAVVNALGVWVNFETGQPARFTPAFIHDFSANLAQGSPQPG